MSIETRTLDLPNLGAVSVSYNDQGDGQTFLLLHGGGGPATVLGFAELLAAGGNSRVITPSHPGFAETARPEALATVRQLAALYVALLDALELENVCVIGNSIGGWIAAELAILSSSRISSVTLVDATGIEVDEYPTVDFFALTFPEIAQRSYFDPEPFRIDPGALSPKQLAVVGANRVALGIYAGDSMTDPTLRERLATVSLPTLLVWGDSDRIVEPGYGQAFADAIPGSTFRVIPRTGHLPQLESPGALLALVQEFAVRVTP